jgi:hypothetical protein
MGHSIQENVAKINSRLSAMDSVSIAVTAFVVLGLALYAVSQDAGKVAGVSYTVAEHEEVQGEDTRPFASVNGPTYTFSWCQGADKIKQENIIYFANAEEAEKSGRTLSKLCMR